MAGDNEKKTPYRWYAFKHWLNLAFVAGAGAAGVFVDPIIALLAAPLELGALWVIPDLPPFRARVDRIEDAKDIARERAYYLQQLWGLGPNKSARPKTLSGWVASCFVEFDDGDLDARVVKRDAAFQKYLDMREILRKLGDLEKVRGVEIVSHELNRFEKVINGYLRYLMACRSLSEGLQGLDGAQLEKELQGLDAQIKDSTGELRAVLLERKRLRETQLDRLPKLSAMLELFRTRADAIVYQMRNIYGQVVADPGADVNSFLEDMAEKHDLLADPIAELEADQAVREILQAGDKTADRRRGLVGSRGEIRQG
jgi:hypothetical protein